MESLELPDWDSFASTSLSIITLLCSLVLDTELNFTSFCCPNCTVAKSDEELVVAAGEFLFGAGEDFGGAGEDFCGAGDGEEGEGGRILRAVAGLGWN